MKIVEEDPKLFEYNLKGKGWVWQWEESVEVELKYIKGSPGSTRAESQDSCKYGIPDKHFQTFELMRKGELTWFLSLGSNKWIPLPYIPSSSRLISPLRFLPIVTRHALQRWWFTHAFQYCAESPETMFEKESWFDFFSDVAWALIMISY